MILSKGWSLEEETQDDSHRKNQRQEQSVNKTYRTYRRSKPRRSKEQRIIK